jgi:hypothetical protein
MSAATSKSRQYSDSCKQQCSVNILHAVEGAVQDLCCTVALVWLHDESLATMTCTMYSHCMHKYMGSACTCLVHTDLCCAGPVYPLLAAA